MSLSKQRFADITMTVYLENPKNYRKFRQAGEMLHDKVLEVFMSETFATEVQREFEIVAGGLLYKMENETGSYGRYYDAFYASYLVMDDTIEVTVHRREQWR